MDVIQFNKTAIGWINYTVAGVLRYNINPETFRDITGVSSRAKLGTCEVTAQDLKRLNMASINLGLADGWELVEDDVTAGVI